VTHKFLDARGLSHPEPLEKAIEIIKNLGQDKCLYMLIHKNPIPLLKIAEENRLNYLSEEVRIGEWHILITPNREINLKDELRV